MPTGSRSAWFTSEDGADDLTVGGRYTGERLFGVATVGRVFNGREDIGQDPGGGIFVARSQSHLVEGAAGFGLVLMPTSRWSVCLGADGLYGASNSHKVDTFRYNTFNELLGLERATVKANSSAWNTALEASVGFSFGEQPIFAPRAGISAEYGGQTFDGASETYTGFVLDIGTGVRYGRVLGLITYFRVLSREFADLDLPPGLSCSCPDGMGVGLGFVF